MTSITIQRVSPRRVRVTSDDGSFARTVNDDSASGQKSVADACKVDVATATRWLTSATGEPTTVDLTPTDTPSTVSVELRGLHASTGRVFTGEPTDVVRRVLAVDDHPDDQPLITWSDATAIAALDVDWHDVPFTQRRPDVWLYDVLRHLRPTPLVGWRTHGRGLRAVYVPVDGFTADELAEVAGLSVRRRDATAGVEVKRSTRHPSYDRDGHRCGDVVWSTPSADVDAIRQWLVGDVTDDVIDEWLEDRGLERGSTYEHRHCPVDPSTSHGRPVFVGESGITCHRCQSLGVSITSRPGWFPYSSLIGGSTPVLRHLVNNITHWEHARHFVPSKRGYTALLKLTHGVDDERIGRIDAGRDLIRLDGRWSTADATGVYTTSISPLLASLPACQRPDGSVSAERVARFGQGVDLTQFGYPPLTPVHGVAIYGQHLDYQDDTRTNLVVPSKRLRRRPRYQPRYVDPRHRRADAWDVIETVFPGVCRELIRLLIAAKGCAEGNVGLTPMILIAGPSGASKSASVTLASTICGDTNTEVLYQSDVVRFRQSVLEGLDAGSYVTFNEVLKEGRSQGRTPRQTLDVVLNLTPDSVSHKLYVGPVALGRPPVFTFTDIAVPQAVRDDIQLARRFVYVKLPHRVDWEGPLTASGVHRIQNFRHYDPEYADACNAVLSEVIDDFFSEPSDLKTIARRLGFCALEASEDFDDPNDDLRALFRAVDAAPSLTGADAARWPGRGYALIRRDQETDLVDLWRRLCDDDTWTESRRVVETDWGRLFGVDPFEVDIRSHGGSTVVIRFRRGSRNNPDAVNGEVLR